MKPCVGSSVAAVALAVALSLSVCTFALTVGGAGYARYWDHQRSHVMGVDWAADTREGSTIEFWVKIVDRHVAYQTVFQGDETDYLDLAAADRVKAGYYAPDDSYQVNILNDRTRFTRAEACECVNPTPPAPNPANLNCLRLTNMTNWEHFAVTWNVTSGAVVMYRNGNVVYTSPAGASANFRNKLTRNMALYFGQASNSYVGGFKHLHALNGILDEIRYWGYPRTQQQIRDFMSVSVDMTLVPSGKDFLNFYYNLDSTFYDPVREVKGVPDRSGNGNAAYLGWLPNSKQVLIFEDSTPALGPLEPIRVRSNAPITGTAPLRMVLDRHAAGAGQVARTIWLLSYDASGAALTTTIESLPTFGSLTQSDGTTPISTPGDTVVDAGYLQSVRVMYTPSAAGVDANFADSFTYNVLASGGTNITQTVYLSPLIMTTPPNRTFSIFESTSAASYFQLGGVNEADGNVVQVVITRLPSRGSLYQAKFAGTAGGAAAYADIVTDVNQLTPITSAGTVVTDEAGVVSFINTLNEFDAGVYSTFQYVWRVNGLDSLPATITISVAQVNIPPSGTTATVYLTEGGSSDGGASNDSVLIQLNYTDVDSIYNPNPHFFFTIAEYPKLGSLLNLVDDDTVDAPLVFKDRVPVVETFLSDVLNCSSQYSYCTSLGCPTARTHPWSACVATCPDKSYHCSSVIGPPLSYPTYGDSVTAWCQRLENNGLQWLEGRLPYPIFISAVEVYEAWAPGSVTRLQATPYGGYNRERSYETKWQTLWSGPTQLVPPTYRIFSPPTCAFPFLSDTIRMEMDTNLPGWNEIGAIKVFGTLEAPNGKVSHPAGKVRYQPPAGVHAASAASGGVIDSFTYTVNDCQNDSPPIRINIAVPPPRDVPVMGGGSTAALNAVSSLSYYYTLPQIVTVDTDFVLSLGGYMSTFQAFVSSNFGGGSNSRNNSWVQVVGAEDANGAFIPSPPLYQVQPNGLFGAPLELGANLTDTQSQLFRLGMRIPSDSAYGTTKYGVWFTINGYVVRLKLVVSLQCARSKAALEPYGNCVPCKDIPSEQTDKLGEAFRLLFDAQCVTEYVRSPVLNGVIYALACVSIVIISIVTGCIVRHRENGVIRTASFKFCLTMLGGAILMGVYVILRSAFTDSVAGCAILPWIAHIAFSLIFASVFAKTWRLRRIFVNKKLKTTGRLTDGDLGLIVGAFVAVVICYLIAWTAVAPVKPTQVLDNGTHTLSNVCSTDEPIFSYVLLGMECLVVLYGATITWDVRHIPDDYNESSHVGSILYTFSFSLVIVLPVVFVASGNTPDTRIIVEQFAVLFVNTAAVLLLFVPKLTLVSENAIVTRMAGQPNGGTGGGGTFGDRNLVTNQVPGNGTQMAGTRSAAAEGNKPSTGPPTPGAVGPGGNGLTPLTVSQGATVVPGSAGTNGSGGATPKYPASAGTGVIVMNNKSYRAPSQAFNDQVGSGQVTAISYMDGGAGPSILGGSLAAPNSTFAQSVAGNGAGQRSGVVPSFATPGVSLIAGGVTANNSIISPNSGRYKPASAVEQQLPGAVPAAGATGSGQAATAIANPAAADHIQSALANLLQHQQEQIQLQQQQQAVATESSAEGASAPGQGPASNAIRRTSPRNQPLPPGGVGSSGPDTTIAAPLRSRAPKMESIPGRFPPVSEMGNACTTGAGAMRPEGGAAPTPKPADPPAAAAAAAGAAAGADNTAATAGGAAPANANGGGSGKLPSSPLPPIRMPPGVPAASADGAIKPTQSTAAAPATDTKSGGTSSRSASPRASDSAAAAAATGAAATTASADDRPARNSASSNGGGNNTLLVPKAGPRAHLNTTRAAVALTPNTRIPAAELAAAAAAASAGGTGAGGAATHRRGTHGSDGQNSSISSATVSGESLNDTARRLFVEQATRAKAATGIVATPSPAVTPSAASAAAGAAPAAGGIGSGATLSRAACCDLLGGLYADRHVPLGDTSIGDSVDFFLRLLDKPTLGEFAVLNIDEFVSLYSTLSFVVANKRVATEQKRSERVRRRLSGVQEIDAAASRRKDPARQHVFLGGSCDPTNWRKASAIPILEPASIQYYNPQTPDWKPEYIQLEARAKEQCHVLLFVIDGLTRAIASMLEATEYIIKNRTVVLVIEPMIAGVTIDGQAVSGRELKDLNRARTFLGDIAERHRDKVSCFKTVEEAVQYIVRHSQRECTACAEERDEDREDELALADAEQSALENLAIAQQQLEAAEAATLASAATAAAAVIAQESKEDSSRPGFGRQRSRDTTPVPLSARQFSGGAAGAHAHRPGSANAATHMPGGPPPLLPRFSSYSQEAKDAEEKQRTAAAATPAASAAAAANVPPAPIAIKQPFVLQKLPSFPLVLSAQAAAAAAAAAAASGAAGSSAIPILPPSANGASAPVSPQTDTSPVNALTNPRVAAFQFSANAIRNSPKVTGSDVRIMSPGSVPPGPPSGDDDEPIVLNTTTPAGSANKPKPIPSTAAATGTVNGSAAAGTATGTGATGPTVSPSKNSFRQNRLNATLTTPAPAASSTTTAAAGAAAPTTPSPGTNSRTLAAPTATASTGSPVASTALPNSITASPTSGAAVPRGSFAGGHRKPLPPLAPITVAASNSLQTPSAVGAGGGGAQPALTPVSILKTSSRPGSADRATASGATVSTLTRPASGAGAGTAQPELLTPGGGGGGGTASTRAKRGLAVTFSLPVARTLNGTAITPSSGSGVVT